MIRILARVSLIAAMALTLSQGIAHGGETCGCDVSPATVRAYDAALFEADTADAARLHAPFGAPIARDPRSRIIELAQPHWLTGYDPERRMPLWVAYRLTASDVAARRTRTQCFRPDPRVSVTEGGTRCVSYKNDGMDRGHMVPSADMRRSARAMVNTYVFTNIAHQYPGFNRTLWRDLEVRIRAMARLRGTVYVLSGAVFDHDTDGRPDAPTAAPHPAKTGRPAAAIASHFYKVAIVPGAEGAPPEIHAWLLGHENITTTRAQSRRMLNAARVPLEIIERMSGLDIAPALNDVRLVRRAD